MKSFKKLRYLAEMSFLYFHQEKGSSFWSSNLRTLQQRILGTIQCFKTVRTMFFYIFKGWEFAFLKHG